MQVLTGGIGGNRAKSSRTGSVPGRPEQGSSAVSYSAIEDAASYGGRAGGCSAVDTRFRALSTVAGAEGVVACGHAGAHSQRDLGDLSHVGRAGRGARDQDRAHVASL